MGLTSKWIPEYSLQGTCLSSKLASCSCLVMLSHVLTDIISYVCDLSGQNVIVNILLWVSLCQLVERKYIKATNVWEYCSFQFTILWEEQFPCQIPSPANKEDFKLILREVHRNNNNTLSGLSLDSIADQVRSIIETRERAKTGGGEPGSKAKPCPPLRFTPCQHLDGVHR